MHKAVRGSGREGTGQGGEGPPVLAMLLALERPVFNEAHQPMHVKLRTLKFS